MDFEENPRDLIWGEFRNMGVESRLLHRVNVREHRGLLVGARIPGQQPCATRVAPAGTEPTQRSDPETFAGTDYRFPNTNVALFTQNIIPLGKHLSLTPGVRLEHISTRANGTVRETVLNGAGRRGHPLHRYPRAGPHLCTGWHGTGYQPSPDFELYANAVQNYRAINFSDIQVQGLSIVVDPNIQDERGANLDLGGAETSTVRCNTTSAVLLLYRDRIGAFNTAIPDPILVRRVIRCRASISDARILGVEGLIQGTIRLWEDPDAPHLRWFINGALTEGKYLTNEESAFSDAK